MEFVQQRDERRLYKHGDAWLKLVVSDENLEPSVSMANVVKLGALALPRLAWEGIYLIFGGHPVNRIIKVSLIGQS